MSSILLLTLVVLGGCADGPAPPAPPDAALDSSATPKAPTIAIDTVGSFTATLSDGTTLRGHAAFGNGFVLRLYAEGEEGLWHAISVHPLEAAGPPPFGTYPLYSVAAVGQLAPGDPQHRANPFSADYVRQAGPTPRLSNASSANWTPIGDLVITHSDADRVDGTVRFTMEAFSMDTMSRQPLTLEATFEAVHDPRLEHFDAVFNRTMDRGAP